jgi:hypothetical protein
MKKLIIDRNDIQFQSDSNPAVLRCRVHVISHDRRVDLFWPEDQKLLRDGLHPTNCRITWDVAERALHRALAERELDLGKGDKTDVPTVYIYDFDSAVTID